MSVAVRLLTADDADAYRAIRLEGVRTELYAFERTFEEEDALPLQIWTDRLAKGGTFGVFSDGRLGGIATLNSEDGVKVRHRAHILGVYVRPELRGTGASDLLLRAVIAAAKERRHLQLYLVASAAVERAVRFYQRLGFVTYGTDQRGLFSESRYYDDYLMVLRLDEGGTESDT